MGGGARQIVSLRPPSCSCGKYTLFHLPCSHMLAVTADLGEDPFPFVAPEYRLEVHKRIFAQKFRPMPHEQYWPDNDYPTLLAIPARQREVKTGRPQHTRIHNEMDTSRQSGLHHCSLCLQRGHDKRNVQRESDRFDSSFLSSLHISSTLLSLNWSQCNIQWISIQ